MDGTFNAIREKFDAFAQEISFAIRLLEHEVFLCEFLILP